MIETIDAAAQRVVQSKNQVINTTYLHLTLGSPHDPNQTAGGDVPVASQ